MPDLSEVETARQLIADRALRRRVGAVDDTDTSEYRPHARGTVGGRLTWWCSCEQAAWPDAA